MNRLLLGFLVLGAMTATATPTFAQKGRGGEASKYGWLSSLSEGKAKARQTGKPLMVVVRCAP